MASFNMNWFNIQRDFTLPCPQCGVRACGKEDILWYEKEGEKIAIVIDGGLLDATISDFFNEEVNGSNYNLIPNFFQEWNEDIGWVDNSDNLGTIVNNEGFLQSIQLIEKNTKWLSREFFTEIRKITEEAQILGQELRIIRS